MNDERLPPVRMPKKLKTTLQCLAKTDGRTLSDYVRRALEQHARSVECFEELVKEKDD